MAVRREVKEVLGRLGLTDAVDEDSGMDLKPGDIEPISSSRIIRLLECARGAWAAGLKQTNPGVRCVHANSNGHAYMVNRNQEVDLCFSETWLGLGEVGDGTGTANVGIVPKVEAKGWLGYVRSMHLGRGV